jgi:hypothetical protein
MVCAGTAWLGYLGGRSLESTTAHSASMTGPSCLVVCPAPNGPPNGHCRCCCPLGDASFAVSLARFLNGNSKSGRIHHARNKKFSTCTSCRDKKSKVEAYALALVSYCMTYVPQPVSSDTLKKTTTNVRQRKLITSSELHATNQTVGGPRCSASWDKVRTLNRNPLRMDHMKRHQRTTLPDKLEEKVVKRLCQYGRMR